MKYWVVLGLCLIGWVSPAQAATLTLTGAVTYQEHLALPPEAILRVRLIDLSLPKTPARVTAEAPIASPGEVPLNFSLNFDGALIIKTHSYALVAEIYSGGKLFFINRTPLALDPLATPDPVQIVINFVGTAAAPPDAIPPGLLNIFWRAKAISGQTVAPNLNSSLSISPDLRAGGRGGCNSYFAQAAIDGSALRFSAVAATRMACDDPANVQETAFFAALNDTRFWRIEGGELYLSDAGGKTLIQFSQELR